VKSCNKNHVNKVELKLKRLSNGEETWYRLKGWTKGQAASERLGGYILAAEGYTSIDPSHPLGGPDGTKDFKCVNGGIEWIGGCYFSRREKLFSDIKTKFLGDLKGIEKNKVQGLVFITNQELTVGERDTLKNLTKYQVDIYHLERLAQILNKTINYGARLEFLDIEFTSEEQLAFFAKISDGMIESEKKYEEQINNLSKAYDEIGKKFEKVLKSEKENKSDFTEKELNQKLLTRLTKGSVFLADLGLAMGYGLVGTRPVVVVSNNISNIYAPTVNVIPVTVQINEKKLPTHVDLGTQVTTKRRSIALAEHIKTIDKRILLEFITDLDQVSMLEIDKAIKIQMNL
jgi:mRNA-degrading endonuclease toxin of MazEF toxin-antitoxin module